MATAADLGRRADLDGRRLADANRSRAGGFVEDSGGGFLRCLTNGACVGIDFPGRERRVDDAVVTVGFGWLFTTRAARGRR